MEEDAVERPHGEASSAWPVFCEMSVGISRGIGESSGRCNHTRRKTGKQDPEPCTIPP